MGWMKSIITNLCRNKTLMLAFKWVFTSTLVSWTGFDEVSKTKSSFWTGPIYPLLCFQQHTQLFSGFGTAGKMAWVDIHSALWRRRIWMMRKSHQLLGYSGLPVSRHRTCCQTINWQQQYRHFVKRGTSDTIKQRSCGGLIVAPLSWLEDTMFWCNVSSVILKTPNDL